MHPDQQVEELKAGVKDDEIEVERVWVLPTHLQEKWSLRRFAEVFDGLGEESLGEEKGQDDGVQIRGEVKGKMCGKRVLLATLGDDSTVVYYVVHDGIVKPRQN